MRLTHKKNKASDAKVDIQMTPMLDMIFQLLVFFILTFRPVVDEGQFDMALSSVAAGGNASPSAGSMDDVKLEMPFRIVLKAGPGGTLAPGGISVGDRTLDGIPALQKNLEDSVRGSAEQFEVIIVADTALQYQYIMQTINAVAHAGIKKIKFATPQRPG